MPTFSCRGSVYSMDALWPELRLAITQVSSTRPRGAMRSGAACVLFPKR